MSIETKYWVAFCYNGLLSRGTDKFYQFEYEHGCIMGYGRAAAVDYRPVARDDRIFITDDGVPG
jgi:hypothetical protein